MSRPRPHAPATSVATRARTSTRSAVGFWLAAATYLVLLAGTNIPTPLYSHYASAFGFGPATLTAVFAVYVAALVPSLLFVGPLSDALGRRMILLPAIALGVVGAALFAGARGTGWLYAARLVQGLALGAASGAVTALIVEREPNADRGRAAMVAAIAAVAGVGSGPLLGGLVAQYLPAPTVLPYLVEITLLLCAGVATALLPEPNNRNPDPPRRPSIPEGIRSTFAVSGATSFVTWAVTAIFLTLVPSYAAVLTKSANLALEGAIVAVFFAASALTERLSFGMDPLALQRVGLAALVVGVGLLCWAGVAGSVWLLLAASVVAGIGQGTAFLGAMTQINTIAPPERHAEVLSGFYVVTYLGTGIPVLGVGFLATFIGLLSAVEWFSAGAAAAAIALLGALLRQPSLAPAAKDRPEAPPGQRSTSMDHEAAGVTNFPAAR